MPRVAPKPQGASRSPVRPENYGDSGVTVILSDLTKVEIAKKHAASDFEAIGNLAVVNAVAGHRKGAIKDGPCFSCWTSRLLRLDPNIAAG
jgi:hypothetical protein